MSFAVDVFMSFYFISSNNILKRTKDAKHFKMRYYIEGVPRIIMATFIFALFSDFFLDRENVENFHFNVFLAITQEPQDIWKF